MITHNLSGLSVLITRPKHQADTLCQCITERGGKTIALPTIAIQPLPPGKNQSMAYCDIAIFVSANAAYYSQFNAVVSNAVIAIGPGTAKALTQKQISVDYIPTHYSTEGLLALPILKDVHHKSIIIFCGENSKPMLKATLQHRGATVESRVCYRRECPIIHSLEITQIISTKIDIILSTSKESLKNLTTLFDDSFARSAKLSWLSQQRLLVIDDTMADLAKKFGFTNDIIIAPNASDQAILDTLIHYTATSAFCRNS